MPAPVTMWIPAEVPIRSAPAASSARTCSTVLTPPDAFTPIDGGTDLPQVADRRRVGDADRSAGGDGDERGTRVDGGLDRLLALPGVQQRQLQHQLHADRARPPATTAATSAANSGNRLDSRKPTLIVASSSSTPASTSALTSATRAGGDPGSVRVVDDRTDPGHGAAQLVPGGPHPARRHDRGVEPVLQRFLNMLADLTFGDRLADQRVLDAAGQAVPAAAPGRGADRPQSSTCPRRAAQSGLDAGPLDGHPQPQRVVIAGSRHLVPAVHDAASVPPDPGPVGTRA